MRSRRAQSDRQGGGATPTRPRRRSGRRRTEARAATARGQAERESARGRRRAVPARTRRRCLLDSCDSFHPLDPLRGFAERSVMAVERSSNRSDLDDLFSVTYEELRRLAATVRRGEASATLNPTALVNDAWLKLSGNPAVAHTSLLHFKRIAARAMRQVLVEAARRRRAQKRGGPDVVFVEFDDGMTAGGTTEDLLG